MGSTNELVKAYTAELRKGDIQKAYRAILMFMSGLKSRLGKKHPAQQAHSISVTWT